MHRRPKFLKPIRPKSKENIEKTEYKQVYDEKMIFQDQENQIKARVFMLEKQKNTAEVHISELDKKRKFMQEIHCIKEERKKAFLDHKT